VDNNADEKCPHLESPLLVKNVFGIK